MKKQIVRVSVLQSAKVAAMLYLIISVPLAALMCLFTMMIPGAGMGLSMGALIVMPIAYSVCGFLGAMLGAWLYNVVASIVGGFEFTTAEVTPG